LQRFQYDRIAEAGLQASVGSVGDRYNNALAETVIGLYKTEVIHRRGPWQSLAAGELATLEWVDWFNHRRLLQPIGNVPAVDAEAAFYNALENKAIAAYDSDQPASDKPGAVQARW
jgi:transposase InsO family protein